MILQPSNVELTKIHYFENNLANQRIPTISQEIDEKNAVGNVVIKKNLFGQKYILKVNDEVNQIKKKSKLRLILYLWVFISITIAFGFGLFFALNNTVFRNKERQINEFVYPDDVGFRNRPYTESVNTTIEIITLIPDLVEGDYDEPSENFSSTTERRPYCNDCSLDDICLKVNDTAKPECITALDGDDPTGCGGLCLINLEYCQKLSQKYKVYQCMPRKSILSCEDFQFNCQNMCIFKDRRCDGVIDCSNKLDEVNCDCDLTSHFQCGEKTSCLDLSLRCDQKIDCWDGSDEQNCYSNSLNDCSPEEFRCNNGFCIDQIHACDGVVHCSDKSDEPNGCIEYILN